MKYDQKTPCNNCPFRRQGHIPLIPTRAMEIADLMLRFSGGTGGEFPCHKTTVPVEVEDSGTDMRTTENSQHCSGALIFALKNDTSTQMMRIASRLGMFNPDALMENNPAVDEVFDDIDEMVEAHEETSRRPSGRKRSKRPR